MQLLFSFNVQHFQFLLSTRMNQDNQVLVRVNGVSKKFCQDLKKSLWYGVKDFASELLPLRRRGAGSTDKRPDSALSDLSNFKFQNRNFSPGLRPGEFWAVKDVSFELRRGECIGLIGHNGAGKTTLLKMLNGLIKPDEGSIEMRGRVGALIALGAGFNPILTGRENIYINGSVLGLTKTEIDQKIDDIIDFSEVRNFIDAPVQTYSSGMQVRLGFAVATALNPDVLILDEVLAVGDAAFRDKCFKRISELRKTAAVIFVSHQMNQVARICDYGIVLNKGSREYLGKVDESVKIYEKILGRDGNDRLSFLSVTDEINKVSISPHSETVAKGDRIELGISFNSQIAISDFKLRVLLFDASGLLTLGSDNPAALYGLEIRRGFNQWEVIIPNIHLKRGIYTFEIMIMDSKGSYLCWSCKEHKVEITSDFHGPMSPYQPEISSWKSIAAHPA